MSKLSGNPISVHVCSLRYVAEDRELLREWAGKILGSQAPRVIANDERLNAHLAGRAAAAWLLMQRGIACAVRPDPDLGFLRVVDQTGSPIRGLSVNISHTADRAVAVLATRSVGIDIESASRDGSRVYRRVATEAELARLPQSASLGLPSIALWSAKEAFSKAVGLGLNFGLQDFQIILEGSPPYRAETPLRGPLPLVDPALVFDVREGFVISVCGERTELERGVEYQFLESPQLRIP